MNSTTHREASAAAVATLTEPMTRADALRDQSTRSMQRSEPTSAHLGKANREIWSRRRWTGVSAIAVALLLALLLDGVSGRTALMAAGTLLAFAFSADRLDKFDE